MAFQVNITARVNSKSIRREQYNGREHIVIPFKTLPFSVVMNGGLYTRETIEANYRTLEGTLAPLGHPMVNGKHVSAFSPEGINVGHIGAWNKDVRIEGNRVAGEKWVDIQVAERTEKGREFLERVAALEKGEGEPISTSVAAWVERLEPNDAQKQQGVSWIANIKRLDHDAILIDEPPAATVDQGVGLMVNADQAVPLQANSGALVGESFREREARLDRAAKERFAAGSDEYAWVADFTETQAIIVRNGGLSEVYGYRTEGARIIFDDTGTPVVRQESWVATVVNKLSKIKQFLNPQARPAANKEGDMPLTPEERADLVKEFGAAVTPIVNAAVADAIKPIADKVDGLEANQKTITEAVTANSRAAEAEKRKAVAEKHGEVVANALSGEALDAMYKSLGTAPALAGNSGGDASGALTADVNLLPKE